MPRYRIFIKIYLWFWLAMVMIVLLTAIDRATMDNDPFVEDMQRNFGRAFLVYGQTAVNIMEQEGFLALDRFVAEQRRSSGIEMFLLDEEGNSLSAGATPPAIMELVTLTRERGQDQFALVDEEGFSVQRIVGGDGTPYYIAGILPPFPRGPMNRNPAGFFARLGVLLLTSAIGCYWLALYLTAPIIKLGGAVRQFAGGNLSVRVGPEMGRRRDEFSDLAYDFDIMAGRIESLLTSQQNLLRDVSHELRSPLARLNVALELVRQRSGPEAEKSLDRIARESDRLDEFIGQILLLNRFEAGIALPGRKTVDLEHLIREVAENADFEAQSSSRAVNLVASEPCSIAGNEESLRRAVENVVRNAVSYTPDGGIVEVSLRRSSGREHPAIMISVRDYGPGVPESELPHLFKPFYRVGEDRDRRTGGAGVGLAITDAAIRFHGGMVRAFNAAGGGLIIVMTLPG